MRRSPHLVVGFGAFPGFEFQCGQFDGAHEAGGLLEMIILGVGLAIDDCLLGERVDDGGLQCVGDDLLSVVIVDLDGVVRLKPVEMRQQVVSQDNARLLAQIRLWVPMKRTWPGFGMLFSRLHMKTANPPWPRQGRSRAKWRNASSGRPRTACARASARPPPASCRGSPRTIGSNSQSAHGQHVERLNKEIRRRTRVVGGFPDSNSWPTANLRKEAGTII